jgi:ribosome-binding factor A
MSRRTEKLNHFIQEEISELLQRQVKDPRLGGFVTVTGVSISSDLRYAKVFISVMGSEEEKRDAMEALANASGFLRKEMGTRLRMRHNPELSFHRDDSIEHGSHILELISRVTGSEEGSVATRENPYSSFRKNYCEY